jgi:hypothetical protein
MLKFASIVILLLTSTVFATPKAQEVDNIARDAAFRAKFFSAEERLKVPHCCYPSPNVSD